MCRRLALAALALWLATATGLAWLFVKGRTEQAADGRRAIVLAAADRDFVLAEMRTLLGAVQGVAAGAAAGDAIAVASAARSAGAATAHKVPPALMASLPLEFKQWGLSVHAAFDDLAAAAEAGEPAEWQLGRLSKLMETCVGCHAAYRIDAAR